MAAARDAFDVGLFVLVPGQFDQVGEAEGDLFGVLARLVFVVGDQTPHGGGLVPGQPYHPPVGTYGREVGMSGCRAGGLTQPQEDCSLHRDKQESDIPTAGGRPGADLAGGPPSQIQDHVVISATLPQVAPNEEVGTHGIRFRDS